MKKKKWLVGGVVVLLVSFYSLFTVRNLFTPRGFAADKDKRPLIVAHRGGAELGQENTLSCIELGIAAGADMVEIDVHYTKDNHIVVMHDTTVDRTTNGKGEISAMTLAQVRELRIKDASGNITGDLVPTLDEVMELVQGRVKLLIEVKPAGIKYEGIEQALMDTIHKYDAQSWVVVQSFDDAILEKLHAISPAQRLEKLFIFRFPGVPLVFDGNVTAFSFEKYSYISSFNIHYSAASQSLINEIHRHGKEVKIWTVRGPQSTPAVTVDGIITDRPDLWR